MPNTDTYNPCYPDGYKSDTRYIVGLVGPQGPQGIQGPPGPQGIPGPNPISAFGNYVNRSTQKITSINTLIQLDEEITSNNLNLKENGIEIIVAGKYLIHYGLTPNIKSRITSYIVGLYQNGTNLPSSNLKGFNNVTIKNDYIVELKKGDIIALGVVNPLGTTINLTTNPILPNAYITLVRIG